MVRQEIAKNVLEIIADSLNVDVKEIHSRVDENMADSFPEASICQLWGIYFDLEDTYNLKMSNEDVARMTTPQSCIEYIAQRMSNN